MKLITRQIVAGEAAERFARMYGVFRGTPISRCLRPEHERIYHQLLALGPTPDPDAVDRITGNACWTEVPRCNECDQRGPVVVRMGDEPHYESSTAWLCPACLRVAVALVEGI